MRKRMEALKKDQKGFTLVELIVVLVILAILAALLVPALLGYIDRARSSKYLEEARSIYTAIQAVQDERYAKGDAPLGGTTAVSFSETDPVNNLVTPTVCKSAVITSLSGTYTGADKKDYNVAGLKLEFKSQDGNDIKVTMNADGSWDTDNLKVNGSN